MKNTFLFMSQHLIDWRIHSKGALKLHFDRRIWWRERINEAFDLLLGSLEWVVQLDCPGKRSETKPITSTTLGETNFYCFYTLSHLRYVPRIFISKRVLQVVAYLRSCAPVAQETLNLILLFNKTIYRLPIKLWMEYISAFVAILHFWIDYLKLQ